MSHPVLTQGRVAVITGAANGIGLSAAKHFASLGMKICMVDIAEQELNSTYKEVSELAKNGLDDILTVHADISKLENVISLKETVYNTFGEVGLLMNNAAISLGAGPGPLDDYNEWQQIMNVNLWGVINGVQSFVSSMIEQKTPCVVINTGSKQGITAPPGNTAYNVAKAGVKVFTEALQHELRNTDGCQITAHLLVPGWTTTGKSEHQAGAWMPNQVIEYLVAGLARGDFYIICPDNEVTSEIDKKRIIWAAGDVAYNRTPLSRWDSDYDEEFKNFSL